MTVIDPTVAPQRLRARVRRRRIRQKVIFITLAVQGCLTAAYVVAVIIVITIGATT